MSSTETTRTISVEVAYATPEEQILFELTLPSGSTVAEVIHACAAGEMLPQAVLNKADVGVFGRAVSSNYVLEEGDRVEFYRPLIVDPKAARRLRAANK